MKKLISFRVILFLIVALSISFFGAEVKAYYLINSHRNVNFTTSAFTDLNITLDRNGSYPSGNNSATISLTVANPNNYDVSYDLSFSNTDATYTIDGALGATYTVLKNSSKTNVIEISGATGSSITITITSVLPYRKEFTKVVTFDNSNPTTSISSTTNVATSQTLTLSLEDASGLNSYYFGTDETPENSDFTSLNGVTSTTINETVSEAGRYYLITRDSVGNESVEYLDFYRVDFDVLNQTVTLAYLIGKGGDSINLPTPTADTGYTNEGNWYTNNIYTTGSQAYGSSYTITNTTTLYAKANANPLIFANQTINKTFDGTSQTASVTGASNGTGNYTYSEVSEQLNGSASNYISLSGTTITIASNAPAGTYTYVINALDNNSASTTNATYTIVVAPGTLSGSVTITGTNTIGETLTANVTNTDNANLSYQWYASTTPGATSGGTPIEKATPICTRVTNISDLHTETCSQSSNYCYADGYYSGGSKNTTTITYGTIWDGSSALKAGDAFDCDVNNNGVIDKENGVSTERFYYVSDRWNEGADINSFDTTTGVLIYYKNFVSGAPSDGGAVYATQADIQEAGYEVSNNDNWHGPVTAVKNLPKTTGANAWRSDLLTTRERTIYACDNENCSNTPVLTTNNGSNTITNPFNYGSTTAARLLTVAEVAKGCKTLNNNTSLSTIGSLSACNFLFEGTNYANSSKATYGPWLETPHASYSNRAWLAYGGNRSAISLSVGNANRGVRPAIEVAKSKLSASLGSSDAENEYTIESGMAGKYIYVEVTAEKDNYTTATWKDATDATNNTTQAVAKKTATLSGLASTKTLTYLTADTMTFNYDGDGTVSCTSSDTTKVTCSVTGAGTSRTLNLTPVAATSSAVTVTISAGAGTDYAAATSISTSVTVNPGTLSGSVTITGTNTIGETLTANVTNTDNANLSYQWYSTTTPGATSGGTPIEKAASNTICTPVTSVDDLHTETCTQSSNFCYADGYTASGSKGTTTITYGTIWDGSSALKAGDAFDCDVNNNGVIDKVNGISTERFYYVSDRWNEGTDINSFDTTTGVLIYYKNFVSGAPSDGGAAYALQADIQEAGYEVSSYDNWHGPVTAVKNLPKTTGANAWRSDLLTTRSRTIYACSNANCSTTPVLTTNNGSNTITNPFNYGITTAARLLTVPEVAKGCKAINGNTSLTNVGSLSACNFLFEGTKYANSSKATNGPWLETPNASTSDFAWYARGGGRYADNGFVSTTNGVRPAIEVPKSSLGGSSYETDSTYTVGSGMAGKYIYVEVTAEKDNYTTATWKDATDATNNTTQAVAKKTATLSGLASSKTLTFPTADTMTFNYDGDGNLSCSTNTSYVTCAISGEGTSKTLTLTPVAATSSPVTVTISAGAGTEYLAASASTSVTVNAGTLSGSVSSIIGTNTYGETLTAAVTNTNSASLSYQWYSTTTNGATSGGSAIDGATSSTYTVGPGLIGKYLYVVVSATKANYNNATWSKAVSGAVAQRAITIHAKNQSIVYGNSISTALSQVEITSGTLATNDAISAITLAASTSNVTSSGTITPSAATIQKSGSTNVTSDYVITYTTGNLTITQKQATITIDSSKTMTYPTNDSLSFTYDGDGTVSCLSGDTTKVTCSITGTGSSRTLNLTPVAATSSAVTVTVSAGNGTNYSAADNKTVSVTVNPGTLSGSVTITGTNKIGETLTANVTNTNNADLSYQWYETTTPGATTGGTPIEKAASNTICTPVTSVDDLHTETCSYTSGTYYCYADGYYSGGSKNTTTITYGTIWDGSSALKAGDAFDCDINNNGVIDKENGVSTERFYYVSDRWNEGTDIDSFDTTTAVLIYYKNFVSGVASDGAGEYHSSDNWHGPETAVTHLPKTTGTNAWRDDLLTTRERTIYACSDANCSTTPSLSTSGGTITPNPFNYGSTTAARLLALPELKKSGCDTSSGETSLGNSGSLSACNFLFEGTKYASSSKTTYGPWLETPRASDSGDVWYAYGRNRYMSSNNAYNANRGVRPAIEVSKSSLGGSSYETDSTYTVGSGMAGKYIYVEVTAEKDNYTTATWKDATDATNNTTQAVAKKTATLSGLASSKTLTFPTADTMTFNYDGDGNLSCSTNTSYVTCAISGEGTSRTLTLTPVAVTSSAVTVTVSATAGTDYLAASNISTSVTVEAGTVAITLNNQSATTPGTATIYEINGQGWYSDNGGTTAISTITIPTNTSPIVKYFGGYYTGTNGSGTLVIDASGNIVGANTLFSSDTTLYANWITVWASNLSFVNTTTGFSCTQSQCAIDELAKLIK